MTTFNQALTRMRRFLRDPSGSIWLDDEIRMYWNEAQLEIATKAGFIERVHAYSYPPSYTWCYLWDWEKEHIEGDMYRATHIWPTRNMSVMYPWEPGYYLSSSDTPDDGTRFTHPWESAYCSPADVVYIPLHASFHASKFAAWDETPIEPTSERDISMTDSWYKTKTGEPINYYRPDDYENDVVLYPRPSSITWDDASLQLKDTTDSLIDTLSTVVTESGEELQTEAGDTVIGDTEEPGGIIGYEEDSLDETDYGVVYDNVETDGHLFMVFEALPQDVDEKVDTWDDQIPDWPPYMLPVVEYATLERCFSADSDGFIPSLRDYWQMRKSVGLDTIKLFKHLKLKDRDFRLGGVSKSGRGQHPRLPSGYPAQWP
uniref:Uncharacterized protein n=1 Tax=viral metagenome TaxID=1070528 RepID=A0A6M3JTQ7_9ZZZZ